MSDSSRYPFLEISPELDPHMDQTNVTTLESIPAPTDIVTSWSTQIGDNTRCTIHYDDKGVGLQAQMLSFDFGFSSTTDLKGSEQKVRTDIWSQRETSSGEAGSMSPQPVLSFVTQGKDLKMGAIQHPYEEKQVQAIDFAKRIVSNLFPEHAANHIYQLDVYKDNFAMQMYIENAFFGRLTTYLRGNLSPIVKTIDKLLQEIEFPQPGRPAPFDGAKSGMFLAWAIQQWPAMWLLGVNPPDESKKQEIQHLGKVMIYYIADSWKARGTAETDNYREFLYGRQDSQTARRRN